MSMIVPATVVVVVGATELARVGKKQNPTMKPVLAGFILGLGLYAIQGLDERLGTLFCALIITATLLEQGPVIFPMLGGLVK